MYCNTHSSVVKTYHYTLDKQWRVGADKHGTRDTSGFATQKEEKKSEEMICTITDPFERDSVCGNGSLPSGPIIVVVVRMHADSMQKHKSGFGCFSVKTSCHA